ncbi:DUF4240 domain-containing protein [Yinghuangia aomiensis]
MDVEEFWALIDDACAEVDAREPDFDDRRDAIERACEERLVGRTPAEIVGFSPRQWQLRDHAYRYDLWAAAFLIEGWWSDDGFMDFRDGLISLGRNWYERALADPDVSPTIRQCGTAGTCSSGTGTSTGRPTRPTSVSPANRTGSTRRWRLPGSRSAPCHDRAGRSPVGRRRRRRGASSAAAPRRDLSRLILQRWITLTPTGAGVGAVPPGGGAPGQPARA